MCTANLGILQLHSILSFHCTCTKSCCIPFQLKYRKDLNKMKGTSHFHSLTSEDNLTLKNAQKINKLVSEVSLSGAVNKARVGPLTCCSLYTVCVPIWRKAQALCDLILFICVINVFRFNFHKTFSAKTVAGMWWFSQARNVRNTVKVQLT